MCNKRHRIFVLGAGFSKAAGYPLGLELWQEIRDRARHLRGRAATFHTDLDNYIEYMRVCKGKSLTSGTVDFEDFMRFLDIEHFLGLRGSDTWSTDGNEGTVVVKTLIGHILAELTPAPDDIPEVYLKFAEGLQPGDYVLTFNYDVLLERALDAVEKPYRLFPSRYKSVQKYSATIDDSVEEVVLLKLHGSIDWFDRSEYSEIEKQYRESGLPEPGDPVFTHINTDELGVTKLLKGPRHSDDPLNEMHRVRSIKALYDKQILFTQTPWLLSPSTMKILYAQKLGDFWYGMQNAGAWNFGLSIIGYSLPDQDEYARQFLYNIVRNYQQNYWNEEINGMQKTSLVVIDRCDTTEAVDNFKSRYSFVDWNRATLHANGFDDKAVDLALSCK